MSFAVRLSVFTYDRCLFYVDVLGLPRLPTQITIPVDLDHLKAQCKSQWLCNILSHKEWPCICMTSRLIKMHVIDLFNNFCTIQCSILKTFQSCHSQHFPQWIILFCNEFDTWDRSSLISGGFYSHMRPCMCDMYSSVRVFSFLAEALSSNPLCWAVMSLKMRILAAWPPARFTAWGPTCGISYI